MKTEGDSKRKLPERKARARTTADTTRDRLISGLHTLGIPRLDREADLSGLRPESRSAS